MNNEYGPRSDALPREEGTRGGSPTPTHHSSLITHYSFPDWPASFTAALERLSVAVRRPAGGLHAGEVRSRARGRALEFADYRAYTPGDDPKLVDWRAYGRLGRLYLKQYEEERSRTICLIVDASASMDWGDGEAHKGLYARRLAAALAWIAVSHHERVRAYLVRDGGSTQLPPAASRAAAVALHRELGLARESGRTDLAAAARALAPALPPGPVIMLTDLLDPTWPDALGQLAPTGEVAVVQLLSPEEWEPRLDEEVELVDSESGEVRPTRLGPVELAAYRANLEAFLGKVESHCRRLGIVHVAVNTARPLQEAVLRQLPAAGVLRG